MQSSWTIRRIVSIQLVSWRAQRRFRTAPSTLHGFGWHGFGWKFFFFWFTYLTCGFLLKKHEEGCIDRISLCFADRICGAFPGVIHVDADATHQSKSPAERIRVDPPRLVARSPLFGLDKLWKGPKKTTVMRSSPVTWQVRVLVLAGKHI